MERNLDFGEGGRRRRKKRQKHFTAPSVIERWLELIGENNLFKQGWIDVFLFFLAIKIEDLVLRNYSYTCLRTVPISEVY